jgi:polysaccharide pyruvyl transferase WcaK-like protein
MRLFVVADVSGSGNYHLGDEAMLEANLHTLRQIFQGIEFTVPSGDPAWTSRRYGVDSVRRPHIPSGHTAESWTRRMVEAGNDDGRWAEWLGDELATGLRQSAGLVVSGGGNLCASWPEQILERVALIEYARELGIPAVMVSQTLGPALTPDQHHLLARSLTKLAWLGVRDEGSAALARELGVRAEHLHGQLDDAFFLEPLAVEDERGNEFRDEHRRWILVTLDASFGAPARARSLSVLGSQLDALAERLQASLVFVPNVGGADTPDTLSDAVAGRALAAQLRSKLLQLDLWQPREVRWLTGRAAMVVSTRYHPIVFATAAGIPAFGIWTDNYTRAKLRGPLTRASLEGWCIPLAEAERGAFLPLALELWHRRSAIHDRLVGVRAQAWPLELKRWNGICRALGWQPEAAPKLADPPPLASAVAYSDTRDRTLTANLSDEQWRQYEENGYLRLGRLLEERDLAALRERAEAAMPGGGEDLPHPAEEDAGTGLEADPLVLDFIRRELFREICARRYGAHASVSILSIRHLGKPAGNAADPAWRQDAAKRWNLDRDALVTLWVALDPATRANGCVQVIPGSHRLGLLSRNGGPIHAADAERFCPDAAIEYLELDAGEGLLLHNWLLHRNGANRAPTPRRALSFYYMEGRTLNTLAGSRFPIVFGEYEDIDSALPFWSALNEENRQLREMSDAAARYARSLLEDNQRREQMRSEAESYAKDLEAELARVRAAPAPVNALERPI